MVTATNQHTSRSRYGVGVILCVVFIAVGLGQSASASEHVGDTATRLEQQRQVYDILVSVRDLQQVIIETRNYALLPQARELLQTALQLNTTLVSTSESADLTPVAPATTTQEEVVDLSNPSEVVQYGLSSWPGFDLVAPEELSCTANDPARSSLSFSNGFANVARVTLHNGVFVCEQEMYQPRLCTYGRDGLCQPEPLITMADVDRCAGPFDLVLPDGLQAIVATEYEDMSGEAQEIRERIECRAGALQRTTVQPR